MSFVGKIGLELEKLARTSMKANTVDEDSHL
jgi:hypothetical protein